jgi:hypothetical protein
MTFRHQPPACPLAQQEDQLPRRDDALRGEDLFGRHADGHEGQPSAKPGER